MFRIHGIEDQSDVMKEFADLAFRQGETVLEFMTRVEMLAQTRPDIFNEALMLEKINR